MTNKLSFYAESKNIYRVKFNASIVGTLIRSDDGYFYFSPVLPNENGLWSEWWIRQIADKLQDLNKDWDNYIMENVK